MLTMQIKVVQNKEELVQFILDNYNKDDYSKLFNSVYTLEDIFYFDEEDDIQASLMKLRNEPRKYPQTVILSNKLFDYQHSCISNGVIYLEDSQEQGNNRMNFLYSDEVHDKDKRIERFIELTNKLGISTFKE